MTRSITTEQITRGGGKSRRPAPIKPPRNYTKGRKIMDILCTVIGAATLSCWLIRFFDYLERS
jgi:hypothetical protein